MHTRHVAATLTLTQAEDIPELSQGRLLELVNTLLTKERDLLLKVRVCDVLTAIVGS